MFMDEVDSIHAYNLWPNIANINRTFWRLLSFLDTYEKAGFHKRFANYKRYMIMVNISTGLKNLLAEPAEHSAIITKMQV
jgi:hypothetical protein